MAQIQPYISSLFCGVSPLGGAAAPFGAAPSAASSSSPPDSSSVVCHSYSDEPESESELSGLVLRDGTDTTPEVFVATAEESSTSKVAPGPSARGLSI